VGAEGVADLGTVDGRLGDALPLLVADVLETARFLPLRLAHGRVPSRGVKWSRTAVTYSSGASRCGACPAPAKRRNRAPGMARAMLRAMALDLGSASPARAGAFGRSRASAF